MRFPRCALSMPVLLAVGFLAAAGQVPEPPAAGAASLARQGRMVEAYAAAVRAAHAAPKDANAALWLGKTAQANLDYAQALRAYERVLQLEPGHAEALNGLGEIAQREGRWAAAVGYFEQALRHKPDLAVAHANLGDIHRRNGVWARAVAHYQAALRLAPQDVLSQDYLEYCRRALADEQSHGVVQAATYRGLARVEAEARSRATELAGRGLELRRQEEPMEPQTIPFRIQFRRDKYTIADLSAEARQQLDQVAAALQAPEWKDRRPVVIEGHACSCGTEAFNRELGQKRGQAIRQFLIEQKALRGEEVRVVSHGESNPAVPSPDSNLTLQACERDEAHTMNRRAVIAEGRGPASARVTFWHRPAGDTGRFQPLSNGERLRSGDQIRVGVKAFHPLHAYVFHYGSAGDWAVLFPGQTQGAPPPAHNPLVPNRDYWIPGAGQELVLDEVPGTEETLVYLSPGPDPTLEELVKRVLAQKASTPLPPPQPPAAKAPQPGPGARPQEGATVPDIQHKMQGSSMPEAPVTGEGSATKHQEVDLSSFLRGLKGVPAARLGEALVKIRSYASVRYEHVR